MYTKQIVIQLQSYEIFNILYDIIPVACTRTVSFSLMAHLVASEKKGFKSYAKIYHSNIQFTLGNI